MLTHDRLYYLHSIHPTSRQDGGASLIETGAESLHTTYVSPD